MARRLRRARPAESELRGRSVVAGVVARTRRRASRGAVRRWSDDYFNLPSNRVIELFAAQSRRSKSKLREKGVKELSEVAEAHMESDGSASVIKRQPAQESGFLSRAHHIASVMDWRVEVYSAHGSSRFGTVSTVNRSRISARPSSSYYKITIPADSIARAVAYAIEQPAEVDINEIVIRPVAREF